MEKWITTDKLSTFPQILLLRRRLFPLHLTVQFIGRRLLKKYREGGKKGLISKRRGRTSNNRFDVEFKQQVIDLLHSHYYDFGPTLANEKLCELHGLKLSTESVRQIMIAEKLWKPKKLKQKPVHQMRPRRSCLGELIQIDVAPNAVC